MPPTILFNRYLWHTNQQSRPHVLSYCSVLVFTTSACLQHTNFLKAKVPNTAPHNEVQIHSPEKMTREIQMLTRKCGPTVLGRNPITSYLTAQVQHTLLESGQVRNLEDSSPKAISNSSRIIKNTTEGGRKRRCVCGV